MVQRLIQFYMTGLLVVLLLQQPCFAFAASQSTPTVGHWFYGIYLNKTKVGWMERSLKTTQKQIFIQTTLQARVGGMGQVKTLQLHEQRSYARAGKGLLQTVHFKQQAEAGESLDIRAKAVGSDKLQITITAGGRRSQQQLALQETWHDALAAFDLVRQGKIGSSRQAVQFDPTTMQNITVTYRLLARKAHVMDGVGVDAFEVASQYKQLQVEEKSWFNAAGIMLQSHVGGFFDARLEPESIAKRLDVEQDILRAAVVKPPQPLSKPTTIKKLQLKLTGMGKTLPPTLKRQRVVAAGQEVTVTLQRDQLPRKISWAAMQASFRKHKLKDPELAKALEPTPFIQSRDPELIRTARAVVGKTDNVVVAVQRLTHFVYQQVKDEYVPAFSNALDVLHAKKGDCTEHSVLFVGLARAAGIPARVAVGVAYWPPGQGFGWHAWAEVYLHDQWVSVDPTWDQPIADATHLQLAGGSMAAQARVVMLLGKMHIVSATAER